MTILITGGAGYIGSHMAYELLDRGDKIVIVDDLSTGIRELVPHSSTLRVGDIGNSAFMAEVIAQYNVDTIIHFAASSVVPDSVADPLGYYKNNTSNCRCLIDVAIRGGVRNFIFSSTAAVYGTPATVPVREDDRTQPISPYGWSKLMAEIMLRDAGRASGLRSVILRYFNVAGADRSLRTGQSTASATHLIKVAIQAALGLRDCLTIFGDSHATPDGTCVRDYIHVSDLVRAHTDSVRYLREGGPSIVLNCGYGVGFSVREVIDVVKQVSGVDFAVVQGSARAGDPASVVADCGRINEVLGWRPRFNDLATIVADAVAWEKKIKTGTI